MLSAVPSWDLFHGHVRDRISVQKENLAETGRWGSQRQSLNVSSSVPANHVADWLLHCSIWAPAGTLPGNELIVAFHLTGRRPGGWGESCPVPVGHTPYKVTAWMELVVPRKETKCQTWPDTHTAGVRRHETQADTWHLNSPVVHCELEWQCLQ